MYDLIIQADFFCAISIELNAMSAIHTHLVRTILHDYSDDLDLWLEGSMFFLSLAISSC